MEKVNEQQDMSEELKPCPFCGSSKISFSSHQIGIAVGCDSCGAVSEIKGSKEQCAEAWNRRALPQQAKPTAPQPLAWMYEHDGHKGPPLISVDRWPECAEPWNETPLGIIGLTEQQSAPERVSVPVELLERAALLLQDSISPPDGCSDFDDWTKQGDAIAAELRALLASHGRGEA